MARLSTCKVLLNKCSRCNVLNRITGCIAGFANSLPGFHAHLKGKPEHLTLGKVYGAYN